MTRSKLASLLKAQYDLRVVEEEVEKAIKGLAGGDPDFQCFYLEMVSPYIMYARSVSMGCAHGIDHGGNPVSVALSSLPFEDMARLIDYYNSNYESR